MSGLKRLGNLGGWFPRRRICRISRGYSQALCSHVLLSEVCYIGPKLCSKQSRFRVLLVPTMAVISTKNERLKTRTDATPRPSMSHSQHSLSTLLLVKTLLLLPNISLRHDNLFTWQIAFFSLTNDDFPTLGNTRHSSQIFRDTLH